MTTRQNAAAVYESAAEMIREGMRYADGPDLHGTASARAWHEAARKYATIPRPDFFGKAGTLAAVARLEHDTPPPDIETKARELENRIAEGDTSTAPRRTWTPGEDGEIDLARVADALAPRPTPSPDLWND